MKAKIAALIFIGSFMLARADQMIESVEQALKDQGFYYGEITGQMSSDLTAAVRRYQIRSGLQVTGQLKKIHVEIGDAVTRGQLVAEIDPNVYQAQLEAGDEIFVALRQRVEQLLAREVLERGLGESKYAPCPLLREHVAAGRLGRKSGRGFFGYD